MRRPLKTILLAAVAALLTFFFAMPFIQQHRCNQNGGHFERTTLTCTQAAGRGGG